MIKDPELLWVKHLNWKYLERRQSSFMNYKSLPSDSWFWKGVLKTRSLLKQGLRVQIFSGESTKVWEDAWIPNNPEYRPIRNPYFNPSSLQIYVGELMQRNPRGILQH
ncbi:hypothetical protein SLA2020_388650 [Shorea laevis]